MPTWETSESINLCSALLQKRGVYTDRETGEPEEIQKLADYVVRCVRTVMIQMPQSGRSSAVALR